MEHKSTGASGSMADLNTFEKIIKDPALWVLWVK
jgi:hypothetical protein